MERRELHCLCEVRWIYRGCRSGGNQKCFSCFILFYTYTFYVYFLVSFEIWASLEFGFRGMSRVNLFWITLIIMAEPLWFQVLLVLFRLISHRKNGFVLIVVSVAC